MSFQLIENLIYEIKQVGKGEQKTLVGAPTYTDTVRIDDNIVADVTFDFDLEQGQYAEISRVERAEPLPPEPKTPEQLRIEQLETDLGNVLFESAVDKARLAELETIQGDMLMEIALLKAGGAA